MKLGEEVWKTIRDRFFFRVIVCIKHQLYWRTEEIQTEIMCRRKLLKAGKAAA